MWHSHTCGQALGVYSKALMLVRSCIGSVLRDTHALVACIGSVLRVTHALAVVHRECT